MRRLFAVLCALFLGAGAAYSQALLPGAFAGWMPADGAKYTAAQVDQLFPGEAAILREYGVEAAEQRAFRKAGETLTVTVVKFRDPTGAFGAFHLFLSPDVSPAHIAELSAAGDTQAIVAVSNLFVRVEGVNLTQRGEDLKALAASMEGLAKREAGPYPALGQYLPAGEMAGSRRFVLGPMALEKVLPTGKGDWAGFDMGAEVAAARYKLGGREATLLLVAYPTPQVAMVREKALGRWFNVNRAEDAVAGRPVIFTRRITSLLVVLADADSQKESDELLARVQYGTELTWNQPGHLANEPPWAARAYGIFLGTFYFLGFAIAVGFGFGGVRLVVKRLFPGKVFDRPESVEILQLGIDSKPIEGKDFYR